MGKRTMSESNLPFILCRAFALLAMALSVQEGATVAEGGASKLHAFTVLFHQPKVTVLPYWGPTMRLIRSRLSLKRNPTIAIGLIVATPIIHSSESL